MSLQRQINRFANEYGAKVIKIGKGLPPGVVKDVVSGQQAPLHKTLTTSKYSSNILTDSLNKLKNLKQGIQLVHKLGGKKAVAKIATRTALRGGLYGLAGSLALETGIEGAKALREKMRAKRIDQYNLEQYGTPERAAETRRRRNASNK